MSAARVGRWDLLDQDDDPVQADVSALDKVIEHYKGIATMMTTQAALLKRIGDGDETLLKGEAADAMRKRASESHEHLAAAGGRYEDVHVALKAYKPELETARSETAKALADAESAADAQRVGEGMPDPVNAHREDDAPPLTESDKQDSRDRSSKIDGAKADLDAAKAKCQAALDALQVAADRASTKIKENWGDDGLKHSGWEAFVHGLNKFLKGLVEILGYIGMALAVLAMLIPGLQFIATAALWVAVASLAISTVLALQGEGSWLNVILGVVGLGAAKIGAMVAKSITASVKAAQGAVLAKPLPTRIFIGTPAGTIFTKIPIEAIKKFSIVGMNKLPGWSSLVAPIKSWSLSGAFGLEGLKQLSLLGIKNIKIPTWVYIGGPAAWGAGMASGLWGAVPPSDLPNTDGDARANWTGRTDWEYNHLTKGLTG